MKELLKGKENFLENILNNIKTIIFFWKGIYLNILNDEDFSCSEALHKPALITIKIKKEKVRHEKYYFHFCNS